MAHAYQSPPGVIPKAQLTSCRQDNGNKVKTLVGFSKS